MLAADFFERVLQATLELTDRQGLGALSKRNLPLELDVEARSPYHHLANKDEILEVSSTWFSVRSRSPRQRPIGTSLSTPSELAEVKAGILVSFAAGEYPHLVEFMVEYAMKPGYDLGNEFLYGLDVILDGVDRGRTTDSSGGRAGGWRPSRRAVR